MKSYFFTFILLLLIGCLLTSCTSASDPVPSERTDEKTSEIHSKSEAMTEKNPIITDTTKTAEESNPTEDTPDITDIIESGGETPLLTLSTYDQYEKLVQSGSLPQSFVTYDQLENIGRFEGLVFLSDVREDDYSQYMYSFVDDTNYIIYLYVYHTERASAITNEISSSFIDGSDMRTLSSADTGIYRYNNLVYYYLSGELLSVHWESDGITYIFSGSSLLSDYPFSDSTFTADILNLDRVQTAIATIGDSMS
ncbi:MAG: hypothetical protein ACI3YK_00360 [Eubacteriales bacterium]